MTTPRVITEELGGSALARAAQRGELPQWYRVMPSGPDGWRAYARDVARASSAWLDDLLPALAPSGPAKQRLQRVAGAKGVVVSTGQQAALFGGPLYTLTKALSALAIADAIEREAGVPAAPVFWAATDDADFQEASCARVALGHEVRALCLPPPSVVGIPMSTLALGDLRAEIAALRQASGSAVDEDPLDAVSTTHVTGATLGGAYVALLRRLLEPIGIAVLDASHPATRAAANPLLEAALDRAPEVDAALRARTDAIIAAGFEPQVELVPGLSLVFNADEQRVKRRTPFGDRAGMPRVEPESLTPNVLLRPVVERAIMPTAAYVAGPGEIAYFAQVSAVAEALDVPVPLVLPRWSATILEPRIERLLDRLGTRREELADPHAVESRLARAAIPHEITAAIERLRDDAARGVAGIASADRETLIPPAALEGLQQMIRRRIERLIRRYTAAVKRREEQLMRDVATARVSLFPDGNRQERVLNFIPFLARNGRPLLDVMRAEAARHAAGLVARAGVRPPASGAEVAERV